MHTHTPHTHTPHTHTPHTHTPHTHHTHTVFPHTPHTRLDDLDSLVRRKVFDYITIITIISKQHVVQLIIIRLTKKIF